MKTKTKPAKKVAAKKVNSTQKVSPTQKVSSTQKVKPAQRTKSSEVKPAEGLKKLLIDEIKDIYWAEKALLKELPKIADKTSSEDLSDAIQNHVQETKDQIDRLEKVFSALGVKAEPVKCEALVGLIKEANQIINETEDGPVRDAGIISAIQKIKHYEIATYGTLVAFAQILNQSEVSSTLEDTLAEEKKMDENLTQIAESVVNVEAVEEMEQDEEE